MAKLSISLDELTRDDTVISCQFVQENKRFCHECGFEELYSTGTSNPRRKELMGRAEESIAEKKTVSFLYIALGEAARKTLLDRKPNMDIKTTKFNDLLKECNDAFQNKRKKLIDRHKFVSKKQKEDESLEQFWPALNGLAANCDHSTQTTGLVYDIFVSNMKNTVVQERLFTEPKDNPEEVLKVSVAAELGAQQKNTICIKPKNIKEEPVLAVEKSNGCYNCGKKPFLMGHQKVCKARNVQCRSEEKQDTMPECAA